MERAEAHQPPPPAAPPGIPRRTREDVAYLWLQRFGPMAAHEFNQREYTGYSENTLATGLSNLASMGKIVGECPPGKRYKVWDIAKPGQIELPGVRA